MTHPIILNQYSQINKNSSSRIKCIEWPGTVSNQGYAVCFKNYKQYRVGRLIMKGILGDISDSLPVDHICNNRKCINPAHLRIITTKENVLRGTGPTAINAKKTHCIRGHEFSGENLQLKGKERVCKECRRNWHKKHNRLQYAL